MTFEPRRDAHGRFASGPSGFGAPKPSQVPTPARVPHVPSETERARINAMLERLAAQGRMNADGSLRGTVTPTRRPSVPDSGVEPS